MRFALNTCESPESYLDECGPQREEFILFRRNLVRDIKQMSSHILRLTAEVDNAQVAKRVSHLVDREHIRAREQDVHKQMANAIHGPALERVLLLAERISSGTHPKLLTRSNYNLVMYTTIILMNLPMGQRSETVRFLEDADLLRAQPMDENWYILHVGMCSNYYYYYFKVFLVIENNIIVNIS